MNPKQPTQLKAIQHLRNLTGLSLAACASALERSAFDVEKAQQLLRAEGQKPISSGSTTGEGVIGCYLHHNKQLGALVELRCQTDFSARNPEFVELANKLAMHVASANPRYLRREDVPPDVVEAERAIHVQQAKAAGRPDAIIESKILPGKMNAFFAEVCLLEQGFVMDESTLISSLIANLSSRIGETVAVVRFVRFAVGN